MRFFNKQTIKLAALVFTIMVGMDISCAADSLAATTNTTTTSGSSTDMLKPAYDSLVGIVGGGFAKIISLTSLAFGLVGSAMRFNPAAIGSAFGVSIAAGVGPSVMESVLGAIF
jgi:hypothetical protein